MKQTALYPVHVAAGGRMVEYAGFMLPVQYANGVIAEHTSVRTAAGLFDVSHMGEFVVSGPDSLANLNRIMTNDFTKLKPGRMRYTVMCQDDGGTLDDLIVGRLDEDRFLLVVNAANREADAAWIEGHLDGAVMFEDISDAKGLIALQGPKAAEILRALTDQIPERAYTFEDHVRLALSSDDDGEAVDDCLVSRTGYTGEDGFELMCAWADTPRMWALLMAAGEAFGLVPCGLGARDTLRLEAGIPLYGHELTAERTPLEAGLDFAVKMKDPVPFIGQRALEQRGTPEQVRVGLKLSGKGIAREGAEVIVDDVVIGQVTSGTLAPSLGEAIAMAYVPRAHSELGTQLQIKVRQRVIDAHVVKMPFYRRHD